ncbi:hypothetical protein B0W48_13835 [Pseudoalteromonas aliena]|uniref:Uncharacterized protein n=1 Tax=Pseudoalteromonas aliena TaxID=247523 RepID=A0A1Q2H0B0_9GAMM|nr:hypothetical protein [Pseudoalteromonas aliena]AQQ00795.1 hypothetical protein B0W48_13835 [Pseudoalteromonas aliena]
MDTHTEADHANAATLIAANNDSEIQTLNELPHEKRDGVTQSNDKKLFKTQKQTALALFAKLLACFPGFTNPQRDDVIIANQVLNYGVAGIQHKDIPAIKESMDSAKSFYNKYARLLGFGIGATFSVFIEWVQSVYPDYHAIRAAHAGSGLIAGWIVNNIMSEYERRIHQLKEKVR